jgi:hypothetical protein
MITISRLLCCGLCFVWLASTAAARATWNSEYDMLMSLPPGLMPSLLVSEPDDNGFIGYHRQQGKWHQAGYQRGGARHFMGGVLAGDIARMERGWLSIEATFARQKENGDFEVARRHFDILPQSFASRVETNFFYLQALMQALLVLRESPYAPRFHHRVEALKPKIVRAADFIMSGRETIVPKVGHTANRLFIAAKALGLAGVYFGREDYQAEARRLVGVALTLRDADGVFLERGGRDSSYNAVSVLFGQVVEFYLPDPVFEEAMRRAVDWQLTRITPEGDVLTEGNTRTGPKGELTDGGTGGPKNINRREIAVALIYHGTLYRRPEAIDAGLRVAAWMKREQQ